MDDSNEGSKQDLAVSKYILDGKCSLMGSTYSFFFIQIIIFMYTTKFLAIY